MIAPACKTVRVWDVGEYNLGLPCAGGWPALGRPRGCVRSARIPDYSLTDSRLLSHFFQTVLSRHNDVPRKLDQWLS